MIFKSIYNYYTVTGTRQILIDDFERDGVDEAISWCMHVSDILDKQSNYWRHHKYEWGEQGTFDGGGMVNTLRRYNSDECFDNKVLLGSEYQIILRWGQDDIESNDKSQLTFDSILDEDCDESYT